MHRVFTSYHHRNDQHYKDAFVRFGEESGVFKDWSVDTGEIPEHWEDDTIRRVIRDDYLRSSSVTVLLVGTETKFRKHIDWELYSSMIDGSKNKRSGLLVVMLPSTNCTFFTAAHESEKQLLYPGTTWTTVDSKSEYERRYPHMPDRLIDNLLAPKVKISVTTWNHIVQTPDALGTLISNAHHARTTNEYDLARAMRKRNFEIA